MRVARAARAKAGGRDRAAAAAETWLTVDAGDVVVETVKRAEDDPRALVVRLYEAAGAATRATLRSAAPVRSAARVNLMEEEIRTLAGRRALTLSFAPFEIVTLRLCFQPQDFFAPANSRSPEESDAEQA